ncbi:hypothetical protein M405DRAFT_533211 [Rhizopogon salebrosus TDB-379]|nr:hypothetical protein M405DRAFT_533211 [Rhizopogon salebrosus TDB-379]
MQRQAQECKDVNSIAWLVPAGIATRTSSELLTRGHLQPRMCLTLQWTPASSNTGARRLALDPFRSKAQHCKNVLLTEYCFYPIEHYFPFSAAGGERAGTKFAPVKHRPAFSPLTHDNSPMGLDR